jgi:hypothetical protein
MYLKKALPGLRKSRNVQYFGYGNAQHIGTVYRFPPLGRMSGRLRREPASSGDAAELEFDHGETAPEALPPPR